VNEIIEERAKNASAKKWWDGSYFFFALI
jgi:hypothetical protein